MFFHDVFFFECLFTTRHATYPSSQLIPVAARPFVRHVTPECEEAGVEHEDLPDTTRAMERYA